MPKGPQGQKRPADTNQLAKRIVDIATGAASDQEDNEGKDARAIERGRLGGTKGGAARAAKLSPEARRESAQKAARARWSPKK